VITLLPHDVAVVAVVAAVAVTAAAADNARYPFC
jgi:hypothetical protein